MQSFSASIEGNSEDVEDSGSDWAKLEVIWAVDKIASNKKILANSEANSDTDTTLLRAARVCAVSKHKLTRPQ